MNRREVLKHLGLLSAAGAAPLAFAQQRAPFETLANRVPSEVEGKIEVIEFFHYGCPHCRNFHPLVKDWLTRLPEDVAFRKVPAIWGNEQLRGLARLYYTGERTETLGLIEEAIFAAVQDERRAIHTEEGVRNWITRFDFDHAAFMDTYKSFALQATIQRADQIARTYRIQGVPTVAVGGRFITSASMTGSHQGTLEVVDQLLERIRNEG
ncbi:MAG TPA: thiol:disulfide interchange protein DsbA/DsbL [Azoarcus taiwanensis]|nr:thiol:disulfide interchange protein DsbA/DsbL [Azoarcus taiwanensis]